MLQQSGHFICFVAKNKEATTVCSVYMQNITRACPDIFAASAGTANLRHYSRYR